MQRWYNIQYELFPLLCEDDVILNEKLEQVIHALEWSRIEKFVPVPYQCIRRPQQDRRMLASAFLAKAVLGIPTTVGLIDRLTNDQSVRRICGFSLSQALPDEATFSRAFSEFAATEESGEELAEENI
jgi:transposase